MWLPVGGRVSTNIFKRALTWATLMSPMGGGSKSSLMACRSSGWRWTPHWDVQLRLMGLRWGAARRRKKRRCPDLLGRQAWAKLVVLAVKVREMRTFLSFLARAKARSENHLLRECSKRGVFTGLSPLLHHSLCFGIVWGTFCGAGGTKLFAWCSLCVDCGCDDVCFLSVKKNKKIVAIQGPLA